VDEWDFDPLTAAPSNTTSGNNARSTENWIRPPTRGVNFATPSATREYMYPWTNQWFTEGCNPSTTYTSPQRNDIDAALANLFAMHNRMHDWAYKLGFTEATWNAQVDNFGNGGLGNDPSTATAKPARSPPARATMPTRTHRRTASRRTRSTGRSGRR